MQLGTESNVANETSRPKAHAHIYSHGAEYVALRLGFEVFRPHREPTQPGEYCRVI